MYYSLEVVVSIDNLIVDIIQKYNEGNNAVNEELKQNLKNNLIKIYNSEDIIEELTECIITLTTNDLDIGHAYYTKSDKEATTEMFLMNELKLRQANESRSKMKNKIDSLLFKIVGKPSSTKTNIRITNIDTFSAYLDRLSTERIKEYYFTNKQNKPEEAFHQIKVIGIILQKITKLLDEINIQQGYEYIGEKRTFDEKKIIEDVNKMLSK